MILAKMKLAPNKLAVISFGQLAVCNGRIPQRKRRKQLVVLDRQTDYFQLQNTRRHEKN